MISNHHPNRMQRSEYRSDVCAICGGLAVAWRTYALRDHAAEAETHDVAWCQVCLDECERERSRKKNPGK